MYRLNLNELSSRYADWFGWQSEISPYLTQESMKKDKLHDGTKGGDKSIQPIDMKLNLVHRRNSTAVRHQCATSTTL